MANTRALQEEREIFSNNEHHVHARAHTHAQLDVATIPYLTVLPTEVGGPIVDERIGFQLGCLDSIPVSTTYYLSDLG